MLNVIRQEPKASRRVDALHVNAFFCHAKWSCDPVQSTPPHAIRKRKRPLTAGHPKDIHGRVGSQCSALIHQLSARMTSRSAEVVEFGEPWRSGGHGNEEEAC